MKRVFGALALVIAPVIAGADPKFEFAKAEEVEKVKDVEWVAAAEIGLVFTTGNSDTTTISAGVKASRKTGKNKLALEGSVTYAKSSIRSLRDLDGDMLIGSDAEIVSVSSVTAETLAAKLRYDRFLTKSNSLFVAALASRDVPAGKDAVVGAQLGYSRQLHKSKTAEAVAEIGYDFSREDLVTGDPVEIHSARAFVGMKAEMTAGTTLDAALEGLTNLNHEDLATRAAGADIGRDTRLNAKVAIAAKISKDLSFTTSFEVKFDNRPGPLALKLLAPGFVPEATKLDTIMKASLIYSFF
jgi:hypothetical protein